MPLRLEIKRKLAQRSKRVKSVDFHPTDPWILASLYSGIVCIWNYQTQTMAISFEVTELPVRSAKFIARKQWVVAEADDMFIRVYNDNTMDKVKVFEPHTDYIRCVAVHRTLRYALSSSDDMLVKLWDWEKGWLCTQISEGHSHYVMQVTFNPKDTNPFASASLDCTIKVIGYDEGTIMVKLGWEVPIASMDNSGKIIWAKHNEIQTVSITSVGADYEVSDGERLPLAVKELGTCDLYPESLKHNPDGRFFFVCGDGEFIIYTALAWRNRSFGSALEIAWSSEGEYAVRESTSRVKIFGKNFQERKSIWPTFSADHIYEGTLLAMCSNDFICFYDWAECRLIRRIDVNVKNLYWADSGALVTIASDTSFYILKYNRDVMSAYLDSGRSVDEQGVEHACELLYEINEQVGTGLWVSDYFIYNNSSWRPNYCVGGEVTTMFHLD